MMKKEKNTGFKWLMSLYLGLMLLFYLGYVFLDNYRLSKSEKWLGTNNLSQVDIQTIQQVGSWASILEMAPSILMVLTMLFLFRYRNSRKIVVQFFILHFSLLVTLFLIGSILSLFLTSPIGNLTQPLILSTFLLLAVAFYSGIRWIIGRLRKTVNTI